jgi:hypothetical protein
MRSNEAAGGQSEEKLPGREKDVVREQLFAASRVL